MIKLKMNNERIRGCYEITKLKGVFNKTWQNQFYYLICLTIYTTGMRNSEIERMRVKDLITYDAMVHFEMFDIIDYVKDANRILKTGGKILFHHSNHDFSPELIYSQKPNGRNYLSANIFKYIVSRCGFKVISQVIMPWGTGENYLKDSDCLSLCQKIENIIT
jgi:cyclopropane fatty-acyl-phospholipid synthase-like methyltransferase